MEFRAFGQIGVEGLFKLQLALKLAGFVAGPGWVLVKEFPVGYLNGGTYHLKDFH